MRLFVSSSFSSSFIHSFIHSFFSFFLSLSSFKKKNTFKKSTKLLLLDKNKTQNDSRGMIISFNHKSVVVVSCPSCLAMPAFLRTEHSLTFSQRNMNGNNNDATKLKKEDVRPNRTTEQKRVGGSCSCFFFFTWPSVYVSRVALGMVRSNRTISTLSCTGCIRNSASNDTTRCFLAVFKVPLRD